MWKQQNLPCCKTLYSHFYIWLSNHFSLYDFCLLIILGHKEMNNETKANSMSKLMRTRESPQLHISSTEVEEMDINSKGILPL